VWPWKKVLFSAGAAEEGVEDLLSGESGGEGEIAAGDSFGDAHEVGLNVFVFEGEHFAGSAEAVATSSQMRRVLYWVARRRTR